MPNISTAADADRLPWLTDEIKRRPKRSSSWVVPFLAASAVALIAALSFWLGMSGALRQKAAGAPNARVELPPVAPSEPVLLQPEPVMPQVSPVPSPEVALPEQKEVAIEAPPLRRARQAAAVAVHRSHAVAAKPKPSTATPAEETAGLKYANPWESKDVSGRMVRVGAYSTLEQGKEAWTRLAQLSPAIKQLPAVVTDLPGRSGKVYYWLQIGTTSQAHSEVLCQRMRAIKQSCVVVDLAGARKGSGNERQPVGI
jgi:hypothetical protein